MKASTTLESSGFLAPHVTAGMYDNTSDTQLYLPLYTNGITGGGISSANSPAPLSQDLFFFKHRMYYFNTQDVQRLTLKVIGVGTGGISDGDWITINGVKFTFRTAVGPATDVKLFTAGTVAQNIENTARSLAGQVDYYFGVNFGGGTALGRAPFQSSVIAYYVSTSSTDAGQVLLQSAVPGGSVFTVQTSSSAGWGTDYTTAVNSDPNAQGAGLMWSNLDQPEGVPLANNAQVGDVSGTGLRGVPLKEAALLFKSNESGKDGLWRLTDDGSAVGPSITIADPTVRLIAPETAVALSNLCFCVCEDGVLAFAENGERVDVAHDQVYRELQTLIAYVGRTTFSRYAFAVAYEAERSYILNVPETPNSTYCTRQYVYNAGTRAWTTWSLPGTICGQVNPQTSQLTFGMSPLSQAPAGAKAIWQERKALDSTDYQDPSFTIASPASTATATMTFAGDLRTGAQAVAIGDLVQQAQATYFLQQRVKGVSYSSQANQTTVTLDAAPTHPWAAGSSPPLTVVKAIQATPEFLPFHGGEPLVTKHWADVYLAFRYIDLDFITVSWASDMMPTPSSAIETVVSASGPIVPDQFAAEAFDTTVFDRQVKDVILKTTLPPEYAESALLTLRLTLACAMQRWELSAIDARVEDATDAVVR
jgi:hypothetical protein